MRHWRIVFVHLADLHLGKRSSQINKKDPATNRTLREVDMERSLELAVDDIIATSESGGDIDCVVIAGDIFDSYQGTPDASICAIEQIRRITSHGISVVGIAGNHDTPSNLNKTPKFRELMTALDSDLVHLAYDTVEHVIVGDTEYVLLPHVTCLQGSFTDDDMAPVGDAKRMVLVVHGVAAGDLSLKQQDEAREVPVSKWIMDMPWDYVAFGHYHKPGWIPGYEGKAAYCGSLENTVISGPDVCMERGPVYVTLSDDGAHLDMHEQPIRRIVNIGSVELAGKDVSPTDIDEMICAKILESDTDDAIVHLTINGITRSAYKSLPRNKFTQVNPNIMYLKINWVFATDGVAEQPSSLYDDDGNEIVDETGTPIADASDESQRGFLPLAKEAEIALLRLIEDGRISSNKQGAVSAILHNYL